MFTLSTLGTSKETLFSESAGRQSVDTWFEVDLPFTITPKKYCLKPREHRLFKVSFSPLEAFDFKVRLKSTIGTNWINTICDYYFTMAVGT